MKNLVLLLLVIFLAACSNDDVPTITDPDTKPVVETVSVRDGDGLLVIDNKNDGMWLRGPDYVGKIVVDPNYYKNHPLKRGEVVCFHTPAFDRSKFPYKNPMTDDVARIIGLPNEKIKIEKGQIYIDDQKLDTFYGKLLWFGQDERTYLDDRKTPKQPVSKTKEAIQEMKNYFETSMSEIVIPADSIFVVADNSGRALDSTHFGPLPMSNINGKVLGKLKDTPQ